MIEFINIGLDNVISFRNNGEIGAADVERFDAVFYEKMKTWEKVGIYMEMSDFDGVSFGVILERLKTSFSLFIPKRNKISKIAVVSNTNYLGIAAEINDLLHSIVTDHFSLEEKQRAVSWLAMPKQFAKTVR